MKSSFISFYKIYLILFTCFLIQNIQAQNWMWAKSHGGNASDKASKVCKDNLGNVYVAGTFTSASMSFGSIILNNTGGSDAYIVKYDSNGNPLWANSIAGSDNEQINGLCTDGIGNVYILGSFTSSVTSIQSYSVSNINAPSSDVFLAVLNTTGTAINITSYGGTGWDIGADCVFSPPSSLFIVGNFSGNSISFDLYNLNNFGTTTEGFIAKIDLNFGSFNCSWATSIGSINANDIPVAIELDLNTSSFYLSGNYNNSSTTTIGTTTLTANSSYGNTFLSKWNTSGNLLWARTFGSTTAIGETVNTDLAIDSGGSSYVAGYFDCNTLAVSTNSINNTANFSSDGYVIKYDNLGAFQWIKSIAGDASDKVLGINVNLNNDVLLCGSYTGTIVVIGTDTFVNTSPGFNSSEIFVSKLNSLGSFLWSSTAPGAGNESANDIVSDDIGNTYVVGQYSISGPTAFGSTTLTSIGSNDGFIAKIACLTASIIGVSELCIGNTTTLTAIGATSYTWNTGATTATIVVSPTVSTTYSIIGNDGNCTQPSSLYSLTVLNPSISIGPDLNLLCNEKTVVVPSVSSSSIVGASWSPTIGLSNPTGIITEVKNITGNAFQYTITANLANGCIVSDVINVFPSVPTPSICFVSVDSVGIDNVILWDKSLYLSADSFFVYRDIGSNNYQIIGKVKNSTSQYGEFKDTVRTLYPANGDPRASSWRYKIRIKDSCGVMSAYSPYHQTLFIQNSSGNFSWNHYQIEGQVIPVPVLSNYVFRRDNNASGSWNNIQTLSNSSTAYTDFNYASYVNTADWRVETSWNLQCESTYLQKTTATVKKSKSNISTNRGVLTNVKEFSNERFYIYPNPSFNFINIESFDAAIRYNITLINSVGQIVFQSFDNFGLLKVDVENLSKGLYSLKIESNEGVKYSKIVLQ